MAVVLKKNEAGIRSLLKGPEMMAELIKRSKQIADAAGPGHTLVSSQGRKRGRVTVGTGTIGARLSQSKNQTLSRAIDAGRR